MAEKATATKAALAPAAHQSIERQNPFTELERIYDSIARRAFDIFQNEGIFGRDLDNWFKAESELLHPLKVNMSETDDALAIRAEVPGFTAKDLDIRMEPRQITISGKRETKEEQKKGKTVYQEHRSDEVLRVIDLPVEADTQNVRASLKDGILELQIPKVPKAKPTRIEVK